MSAEQDPAAAPPEFLVVLREGRSRSGAPDPPLVSPTGAPADPHRTEGPGEPCAAAQRPNLSIDDLLEHLGITRPAWQRAAACRGQDSRTFFPGRTGAARELLAAARAVCDACPVADQCAEHAIANHEGFGVWGGTTERQRRAERRRRRRVALEDPGPGAHPVATLDPVPAE